MGFDKLLDYLKAIIQYFNPVVEVKQMYNAVMLRRGKFRKVLYPGWSIKIPIMDTIIQQNVNNKTICIREVNITTKDGKSVSIAAKFNVKIVDIHKAVILTDNWQGVIVDTGRGIISDRLARYNWEEICNGIPQQIINETIVKEGTEIGLEIWNLAFTDKLGIFGIKTFNS